MGMLGPNLNKKSDLSIRNGVLWAGKYGTNSFYSLNEEEFFVI